MSNIKILKMILDKSCIKIAKQALRDSEQAAELIRIVIRDPRFQDFSVLLGTGTAFGGMVVAVLGSPIDAKVGNLTDKVETLVDQVQVSSDATRFDELSAIRGARSLDSQETAELEVLTNKIIEKLKTIGLVPQDGVIHGELIKPETPATTESIESKTPTSNDVNKTIENLVKDHARQRRNERMAFGVIFAVIIGFAYLRPSKALEFIQEIALENEE